MEMEMPVKNWIIFALATSTAFLLWHSSITFR
jgi:hypothetical protein